MYNLRCCVSAAWPMWPGMQQYSITAGPGCVQQQVCDDACRGVDAIKMVPPAPILAPTSQHSSSSSRFSQSLRGRVEHTCRPVCHIEPRVWRLIDCDSFLCLHAARGAWLLHSSGTACFFSCVLLAWGGGEADCIWGVVQVGACIFVSVAFVWVLAWTL